MVFLSFTGVVVHSLLLSITTDDFQQRGIGSGPMTDLQAFVLTRIRAYFTANARLF